MRLKKPCLPLFALVAATTALGAIPTKLETLGRKAERVEQKRVEKQLWTKPQASGLQDKSFPITEWNKHFSSLGSKRAAITMSEKSKKERFEVKKLEQKTIRFETSPWSARMAELHERAGIELDDEAQLTADRKLYNMMLQDVRHYQELAEELSLRDLNRFQFRRNRAPEGLPVQKAGSSE